MYLVRQFLRQNIVNTALTLHPRKAGELRRYDPDREMCLALASIRALCTGMAGMAGAVILNDEQAGRKSSVEFVPHCIGDAHA